MEKSTLHVDSKPRLKKWLMVSVAIRVAAGGISCKSFGYNDLSVANLAAQQSPDARRDREGCLSCLSDKTLNLRDRRGPRRRVSRMMHHALHDNRSNSPPVTQPHLHNFYLVTANIVPITPGFTPYGRFANENSNFSPRQLNPMPKGVTSKRLPLKRAVRRWWHSAYIG